MTEKQRIEKACGDEAFQAALQRYAHANGSSMAIMHAAARALAVTEDPATEIASLKQSLAEAEGQIRHLEQALARETNRRERAEEELECLHMVLDDRRVPRKVDDNQLSLVGRVDAHVAALRAQIQEREQ